MAKLFSMLPCYNEALNVGRLIDEWMDTKAALAELGYELVVCAINDYSTDDTREVILQKKEQYPENVILIDHEINKGLSGGLNTSIDYFMKNGLSHDLMSIMDGDDTHNPQYIVPMIKKLSAECDCVIASRYREGSSIVGVAKHREFMSDMARYYYSTVLHVPNVRDYTCGYRVYTFECIYRLFNMYGQNPILEKSFACMMELLYKAYLAGAKFDEVGFMLRYDNKQGESKMKVFKTMRKSLSTALKLRLSKKNTN